MSIRAKTRKILWSRSGNRCLLCKAKLVQKLEFPSADFVVGEECHIISPKEKGPRNTLQDVTDYDSYENLLLLCPIHHKMIDEFPETYTVELLVELKVNHEKWIEAAIEKDLGNYFNSINNIEVLDEITNKFELDVVIRYCHFYFFDFSSISDDNISVELAEFFDELRDYSDINSEIEFALKTKLLITYENQIKNFNKCGVRLFGKSIDRKYSFLNNPESEYKIAMVIAYDPEVNPAAIQDGKLSVTIPPDFVPSF